MRTWIRICFTLSIVLAVAAGCGAAEQEPVSAQQGEQSAAGGAGQQASVEEHVELTYFSWNPATDEMNRRLIAQFEAMYPHVKIVYQSYEPSNYWPKLSAMAATGSAPDVFDMSSGYVDEWALNGLLYNLQPFIDRDINEEEYYSSVFDAVRFPDKQTGDMYAFPYAWVTTVLYYNKDMFDEAGLAYPTQEWTWDDFLHAAQSLTIDKTGNGRPDQWGFWLYGRYAQIEPWIYQNHGRLLNEDKTRFEPNEQALEALRFLTDLTLVHQVSPRPKDIQGTRQQDLFPMGRVAMWVDGSWNIENNRNIIGDSFQWGISTVPRGNGWVEDVTYGWPDNISISSTTKHADVAWEFIKFMSGPDRSLEDYAGGKVPIYRETATSEAWLELDQLPENKQLILQQGERFGPNPYTVSWSEWRGYGAAEGSGMNGEIDQILDGEKSFEEALDSLHRYANQVLEEAYRAR